MDISRRLEKIQVWLFLHELNYYDKHRHEVPGQCKTLEFVQHGVCIRCGQELRKLEFHDHISKPQRPDKA